MQLFIFVLIALVVGFWIARSESGDKVIRWFDDLTGRVRRDRREPRATIDVEPQAAPTPDVDDESVSE